MLLMHGLSYGSALTRNTKEIASVYQSDKEGLKPTRVTSHTILPPKAFKSSMKLQHVFYSELSCRNWNYHQLHSVGCPRNFLHLLAERDYNCTLGSVKMIQLTSQEKTLSQPLDNIFSRSRQGFFYTQDNKEEHITTIRSEAERVIVWVLGRDLKLTREHLAVAPCRRLTQFLYH